MYMWKTEVLFLCTVSDGQMNICSYTSEWLFFTSSERVKMIAVLLSSNPAM
jgi:hypothetical protein